jgi:hypothetical protein
MKSKVVFFILCELKIKLENAKKKSMEIHGA